MLNKNKFRSGKLKNKSSKNKSRKIKGGFLNVTKGLDSIKNYVKNKFIHILLSGQTPIIKKKLTNVINNDIRFKKLNIKIDLFIDRIQTLIEKIAQTITTTTIKITSSWAPGFSIIGAILTTTINWAVIYVKMLARTYDLYHLYNEMKVIIKEQGGKDIDLSNKIGNLQNKTIQKVANATVPQQILNKIPNAT